MHHPLIRHLAATLILVVGGLASADPLISLGGPAVSVDVDSKKANELIKGTAEAAIDLLEAIGDFICKLIPCAGTGGSPEGGGQEQAQSVLPIPDDWVRDPRYVNVSGEWTYDVAADWLRRLRVASSTYEDGSLVVMFERMAERDALAFLTFHQDFVLPAEAVRAFRLEGTHVIPAGMYRLDGVALRMPVESRR